jgi:predicted permease
VDGEWVPASCALVTGSYFPTLGAPPGEGRLLEPSDDVENAAPVAVISSELSHQRQIGVGSTIRINTFPFTVVGVLPPGYRGIERTTRVDVWIPAAQIAVVSQRSVLNNRSVQSLFAGGRLKPGGSLSAVNAELAIVARQLQAENGRVNYGMGLTAKSFTGFRYALDGSARVMVLLCALVWLLFALAFTNFFALTLLRLLDRRRELAVKVALGATRAHLARRMLGELGCIAAAAFATGSGLAWVLLRVMQHEPRMHALMATAGIHLDPRALAVASVLVAAGALAIWFLVMRTSARIDVLSGMKEGASAPGRQTAFGVLFAAQFAIALFLGATASAFIDALQAATNRAYPFRTENLLMFDVNFRHLGLASDRVAVAEKFLQRLRAVPGVVAAGGGPAPLGPLGWTNIFVDGRDPSLEPDKAFVNMSAVTGDYAAAAGIRVVRGRGIETREVLGGGKVVMINAAAARRFWPGADPVGHTMKPWENSVPLTIVGVLDDVPVDTTGRIVPQIFMPWGFFSATALTIHVAVEQDSAAVRQALAASVQDVWPHRTPPALRSIQDQIGSASADLLVAVRIIFWVSGFAMLVTSCGLYFFSAYTAAQTIKDSAIRQALGANRRHLIAAHLARYRVSLVCGCVVGLGLLAGVKPLLASLGVAAIPLTPADAALAVGLLLLIAGIGLCVPLHRVLRVNLARTLSQGG